MTAAARERLSHDQALDDPAHRYVERLAPLHARLCPRQVLGARIGLHGAALLGLELPRTDKRLLTIVETDGCFVDGVIVSTGCRAGRRTLRVLDHGKVAATFVDVLSGRAVRVHPRAEARQLARFYAPDAADAWHAQLDAYGWMPASELLEAKPVELLTSLQELIGRAGVRVECARCCEEILNERQVQVADQVLCRGCAGEAYVALAVRRPEHDLSW
jgi:formylmethanofuran dehydrogenase subunit E